MNPTLKKIGRWSGIIAVGIAILIVLFYAEENWRGARAWTDTKKFWEAQGESFDFNRLIPPPVPDAKNIAALPLFGLEPDPANKGELAPLVLRRATRADLPGEPYHLGNWQAGKLTDIGKVRQEVAAFYSAAFGPAAKPLTPLAQLDALYPFIGELRSAMATRPYWSFSAKTVPGFLDTSYVPYLTSTITPARIIVLHAVLALDGDQLSIALSDIAINLRLIAGLTREPYLVSGFMAVALNAMNHAAVYEGLSRHAWNDAQLAQLQADLAQFDLLADYKRVMRGECTGMLIPGYDQIKGSRIKVRDLFRMMREGKKDVGWADLLPNLWPDGWFDIQKAEAVSFDLSSAHLVNPAKHLVLGANAEQKEADLKRRAGRAGALMPWNILFLESAPIIAGALEKFAYSQVAIDESYIVCALERYRLVHGAYPATLDVLVPSRAPRLPHDIMNGQPYHYRLQPDGMFLLYSVGWNQQDDGGKVIHEPDRPRLFDSKLGDWVWPSAPRT